MPPHLRSALHQLPLAIVWLLAAWPGVLWLVHARDPESAVRLAQATGDALWRGLWWTLGGTVLLCLVFPPAAAWLRLCWNRTWTDLTLDTAPLRRAEAELRHFETAARHLEIGRLLRLRRRWQPAGTHLARAVELDPTIATAWHQLGLVHFAGHRWAEAAAAFAQAEQLDAGHAFGEALLHLGRCRFLLGDATALEILRTHQQRHGGGSRSHVWLAEAMQAAGDAAGAAAALRTAAAPVRHRLTAEDNWFRAVARVRLWGKRGHP